MSVRPIKQVLHTQSTREGAGVRLERAFGFGNTTEFDPFLKEKGTWVNNYFDDPNSRNVKRKLIFKNMARAVESA